MESFGSALFQTSCLFLAVSVHNQRDQWQKLSEPADKMSKQRALQVEELQYEVREEES